MTLSTCPVNGVLRGICAVSAVVAIAVLCNAPAATASLHADHALLSQFESFKALYGKLYGSPEEEEYRLTVFRSNMIMAELHNAANPNATFGETPFSDLTREEFKAQYTAGAASFAHARESPPAPTEIRSAAPTALDWREKGAVTPVKSQGTCGACWAFASMGVIEGAWKLFSGRLTSLSAQQLVSCDTLNVGCVGGVAGAAFAFLIQKQGGLACTEESWPYTSSKRYVEPCDTSKCQVAAHITSYAIVPRDEEQIAAHLAEKGPLAMGVDADSFQSYRGGVMTYCITQRMNHVLLLVGYNSAADPPYWIAKNSWGTGWGEKGYIRLKKGTNQCLMREYVVGVVASGL